MQRALSYVGLIAAVVLSLATLSKADAQEPPEALEELEQYRRALFNRVAPSVVFINREKGIGSGFFVDGSGLVLTNAHVVGEAEAVDVILHDGTETTAKVVERARDDVDLALIRLEGVESEPLELGGADDLHVGNWAAVVGHGMGGAWTFTTGIVTNIYPTETKRPVFQTQIPLNPGASGGPVLDRKGRVVGVVTSGVMKADNINFAIRIDLARKHLDSLPESAPTLTLHAPDGAPVFVDGEMVGTGPEVRLRPAAGEHEVFIVVEGEMRKRTVDVPETSTVDLTETE